MKKILSLIVSLALVLSLAACGGSANEKGIIGVWKITDTETETTYGLGIEFMKDGTLRYGLTEDVLDGSDDEDAVEALEFLMKMEYEIKSDTEMEVTVSALMGLSKETTTVEYALDGDSLTFDGATYTRYTGK